MPRGKCETITSKNDIEVTAIGPELICRKQRRSIGIDTHENNSHRFYFSRRYFVVDCATPPPVSAAVSFFRCDTHNVGSICASRYSYARHIYLPSAVTGIRFGTNNGVEHDFTWHFKLFVSELVCQWRSYCTPASAHPNHTRHTHTHGFTFAFDATMAMRRHQFLLIYPVLCIYNILTSNSTGKAQWNTTFWHF